MKSIYGIIFLSIVLSSCAITDKRNNEYFYTHKAAVDAAFDRFLYISIRRDREYGGVIYRDDKGYFYTFSRGLSESGRIAFEPQKLSASAVAIWHTHGDSDSGPSDMDIALSERMCSPLYVMNKHGELFTTTPCNLLAKN